MLLKIVIQLVMLIFISHFFKVVFADSTHPSLVPNGHKIILPYVLQTGKNPQKVGDFIKTSSRCALNFTPAAMVSMQIAKGAPMACVPWSNMNLIVYNDRITPDSRGGYSIPYSSQHSGKGGGSQCEQWPISVYWVVYCNPN